MWFSHSQKVVRDRRAAKRMRRSRTKRPNSRQPRLESLEARVVLSSGLFTQSLGPTSVWNDYPRAAFVDSSEKIVVAGNMNPDPNSSNVDVATFRFTSDGNLDTSFSGDGIATTDVTRGAIDTALDAVEYTYLGAKKTVVAGRTYSSTGAGYSGWVPILLRYNADGTLDSTFGSKGVVKSSTGGFGDVLVQDGKILALGTPGLVRYTSSGQLDRTFDGDGIIDTLPMRTRVCMAIQGDYVVVGGYGPGVNGYDDFILARYRLSDGSLDTTFGTGGTVTFDVGFSDKLTDLEINDSEIIAVGRGWGSTFGFPIVVRYDDNRHRTPARPSCETSPRRSKSIPLTLPPRTSHTTRATLRAVAPQSTSRRMAPNCGKPM
jgi:uncharacterized delta-60 repeat protein